MALMSEFKEERDAVLKHSTLKQKAAYIWDYYKWHITVPIIIIIAIISCIVQAATAPDVIMNGVLLNVRNIQQENPTDTLLTEFYKEQGINSKKEEISLNTNLHYTVGDNIGNYECTQAIMAWHAAGQLDFITGDASALTVLAYNKYFTDLRDCLTDEQIEAFEPYFLYMDYDFYAKRAEIADKTGDVSSIKLPDCTKPEEMTNPIPVMIDMSQSEKLTETYGKTEDVLALGITVKHPNKDITLKFLDYLME